MVFLFAHWIVARWIHNILRCHFLKKYCIRITALGLEAKYNKKSCIGPYVQLKLFLIKYVPINVEYFASNVK